MVGYISGTQPIPLTIEQKLDEALDNFAEFIEMPQVKAILNVKFNENIIGSGAIIMTSVVNKSFTVEFVSWAQMPLKYPGEIGDSMQNARIAMAGQLTPKIVYLIIHLTNSQGKIIKSGISLGSI